MSTNEAPNVYCNRAALLDSTGLPEVNFSVNVINSLQFSITIKKKKKTSVYIKNILFSMFLNILNAVFDTGLALKC